MRRQTSPVAARYLLARLRPLTQPIFWGPLIALMLVILFTWQYWMRPEWIGYFGVKSSSGDARGLSSEDQAIGADIDTLPMLFNDFEIANSTSKQADPAKSDLATASTDLAKLPQIPIPGSAIAPSSSNETAGNSNPNVFEATMQKIGLPNTGLTANSVTNGATSSTQSPNNLGSILNLNNLLGFPTVGTSTESPRSTASINYGASPESLVIPSNNRPAQAPASFTSIAPSAPIEGTTSLGSFGVNAATSTTSYSNNSYTNLVEGTQPLPVAGTVQVAPVSPLSTPPQPILSPQPLSNSSSLNAAPALVPQQPQTFPTSEAPFTAPRPIPGRVLGGGQINTFSNP